MSRTLFLEDVSQWYDQYEVASPKEQYEQLVELVSTPLDPHYVNGETELGDVMIEMQSLLESLGLFEDALTLTKLLQEHQPEFYEKEFCYLGNFLIQYGLFQKDDELIDNALERYKQDPVKGIDMLRPMFYDLCFYDESQRVVDLCRVIYTPVKISSKLFSGSEVIYGQAVLADLVGALYEQQKQGHSIDWDAFKAEADSFGLDPDVLPTLSEELTGQGISGEALIPQFRQELEMGLRALFTRFQMWMLDQRNISFVCSQSIWFTVFDFLESNERLEAKKKIKTPDQLFSIDQNNLDRYVAQLLSAFFSDRKSEGFATLWGIPHVYEFLLAEGLIDEAVYDGVIAAVSKIKKMLLKQWSDPLWRYCFVHHWGKPNYQSEEDFESEAQRFVDSAKDSEPLSEEPSEPFSLEKAVDGLSKAVAEKMVGSIPKINAGPSPSPKSQKSNPPQNQKQLKFSKPRKSGLSEIKALTKKSKTKKKKKKKGF